MINPSRTYLDVEFRAEQGKVLVEGVANGWLQISDVVFTNPTVMELVEALLLPWKIAYVEHLPWLHRYDCLLENNWP
jgi:hypothetical protein